VKELTILSVKINNIPKHELLRSILNSIRNHNKFRLYTINNEFIVEAQSNEPYRKILNKSTCSIADSGGVVWAVKKIAGEKIERIPGADFFYDLLELAEQNELGIFLLGGERGVGKDSVKKILSLYPNIKSIEYCDGVDISPNDQNIDLVNRINRSGANMIFVALGSPKQEVWIDKNQDKLTPSFLMGVGGTLDFVSGKIKRAPVFMREHNLEWLFRLIQQPSRAKRILKAVITFPLLVIFNKKST